MVLRTLACMLVLVATAVNAEAPAEENGVLVLTEKNFQDTIKSSEYVLVEFYAPWCGHCKALAPEYEKAASMLKEKGSGIKLAKVDATVEASLGNEYKIQGYPTLKFFRAGADPLDYEGARDAAGIVAWLDKKTGPPCVEVKTKEELDKLIKESNAVVAGYFKDTTSENAKLFEKVAVQDDKNKFAFIKGDSLKNELNAKDSAVFLLKNFDEPKIDFDGEFVENVLQAFIGKNSRPDLYEFSDKTAGDIFGAGITKHLIVLSGKSDKNHEAITDQMRGIAKQFKDEVIFVHVDTDVDEHVNILDFLGVKKSDLPTFVIFQMDTAAKFLPENKEITKENVENFVKEYLAGNIKQTLKSADLPSDWDSKPVKVLVGSNFQEVAMDKSKDVYVEFYAPWCGHCQALEPVWIQLAEKVSDRADVVIAKMDGTENDVEGMEIKGYPTIKLFKKESNEIVDYNGGRDLDSLVKFVETGEQSSKSADDDYEVIGGKGGEKDEDYEDDSGEEDVDYSDEDTDDDDSTDPKKKTEL